MPPPTYLTDYLYRFSNDECDPLFHYWSALTLLGHVMGRRYWIGHGRFKFRGSLYTGLVGTAGSGKSTAKEVVRELYVELFPDQLLSATVQTREHIINRMVDFNIPWRTNPDTGQVEVYHPFFFAVDELRLFLTEKPERMLAFLIAAFDTSFLDTGFKKDEENCLAPQKIPNPHITMLACVQPDWFLNNLKTDIFTGGLGRRMIIVFRKKFKLNDDPHYPKDSEAGWKRVKEHLKNVGNTSKWGEFKKDSAAAQWYSKWHMDPARFERYDDPMLRENLLDTQHVLLNKCALLQAATNYEFKPVVTEGNFIHALHDLHELEDDIAKLMSASGQNAMAPIAEQMVVQVDAVGGYMQKAKLLAMFYKHGPNGMKSVDDALNFLRQSNRMIEMEVRLPVPGDRNGAMMPSKVYMLTEAGMAEWRAKGIIKG